MVNRRSSLPLSILAAGALAPASALAVEISAGDWTFTATGNVNVHYIYSNCEEETVAAVAGGLACRGAAGEENSSSISNGLLPAALAIGASTTQGGYDIGVTFGFFPGISTNDGGSPNLQATPGPLNTALGTTALDIRQVFLTFGNETMGTFKLGRDIGLFGADAILKDMTIRGVGSGNGNYASPANTSLGSIGLGYIYADWLGQITYTTPNFNGWQVSVGVFDPLEPLLEGTELPEAVPGFHGKVSYTLGESFYVSVAALYQEQEGATDALDYDSWGVDVFASYTYGPWDFFGYYYNGSGIGTTGLFVLSSDLAGNERDSDGFLLQATYTLGQTTFGVNYGQSNLDLASGEAASALVEKNRKYTVGVYHQLTEALTLLAEFSDTKAEAHNGLENDSWNVNIGAFLSF